MWLLTVVQRAEAGKEEEEEESKGELEVVEENNGGRWNTIRSEWKSEE